MFLANSDVFFFVWNVSTVKFLVYIANYRFITANFHQLWPGLAGIIIKIHYIDFADYENNQN